MNRRHNDVIALVGAHYAQIFVCLVGFHLREAQYCFYVIFVYIIILLLVVAAAVFIYTENALVDSVNMCVR